MLETARRFLFPAALLFALSQLGSSQDAHVLTNPRVSQAVAFAVIPSLRELIREHPQAPPFDYRQGNRVHFPKRPRSSSLSDATRLTYRDPVTQNAPWLLGGPTKLMDWLGLGSGFFGYSVHIVPSDINASVGDTEIIQWGNNQFAVFDLNGNNLPFDAQPYVNGNILFSALPRCSLSNDGDPIAQWDKIAHRWVMLQAAELPPARDCIAVSQTADALGPWYAYEFPTLNPNTDFPDYTKLGVWPDAYYVAHNDFDQVTRNFKGTMPCAYERAKLLAGDPSARQVCFLDSVPGGDWAESFDDNQLPSDLDSPNSPPPSGMPNIYMGSITNTSNGFVSNVYYYKFHVDWNNPANSTFSCIDGGCAIAVAQFYLGSWLGEAPEPGGAQLQTVGDLLMYRLAYRVLPSPTVGSTARNPGTVQSWLVSHAVASGGRTGVRWYEFRAPLGSSDPLVYQQGTYSPDTSWRFMSSIAMDRVGNIAMSYTVTNGNSVYPSMAFTGRSKNDPLGTMGPEQLIVAGTGSQIDSDDRWGDYYSMSISNDGCTFVATGEYYSATSSYNWSSRVAKLKFDNCNP